MRTPDPAPAIEVTAAERHAVEAALRRRDLAPRVRERLEMVKAAALGHDLGWIARWSGRAPDTVRHWLRRFRDGGVAALADAPVPGARRRPTPLTWPAWTRRSRRRRGRWGCPSTSGPRRG